MARWSATSGGSGGAAVPGPSDVAIFDRAGLGNSNFNDAAQISTLFFNQTVQTSSQALVFEAGATQTVAGALTFNDGASATRA